MANDFFGPWGNLLTASDGEELRSRLDAIDISVARAIEGQNTAQRERYCVVQYLRTLQANGLLEFPIAVHKSERPDFDFSLGLRSSGLEVTEVISSSLARAGVQLEASPEGAVLEGSSIRLPGQSLQGPMDFPDEPERRWTEQVLNSIRAKTLKLQGYRSLPAHRLLLYDNSDWRVSTAWTVTELPARLATAIRKDPDRRSDDREFVEVSVLRDRVLLFDVTGSGFLLPVPTGEDLPSLLPLSRLEVSEDRLRAFCDEHRIRKLGFFGSVRDNRFGPQSDVDVLVEFESNSEISLFDLVGIEHDLTALLQRKVDLRTVPELSRYFREEVFRNELELAYVAS